MKKILLMAVAAMMAIGVFAQETVKKVRVYMGNNVVFEQRYDAVDSVVFVDIPSGALGGKFSISADQQIQFSQGNLQYQASTDTWRFAENQYDIIGEDNINTSPTYDGWIDLFGWGTGNNPTLISNDAADYAVFTDWGTNKISNGGNLANYWRSMSKDEWVYLFCGRANAANLIALGRVAGMKGTILLPDNWQLPEGAEFTPSATVGLELYGSGDTYYDGEKKYHYNDNTYTAEQWVVMESAGAVFLPAAGTFDHSYNAIFDAGESGFYRTSTPCDPEVYYVIMQYYWAQPNYASTPISGMSVRLVH